MKTIIVYLNNDMSYETVSDLSPEEIIGNHNQRYVKRGVRHIKNLKYNSNLRVIKVEIK